MSKVTVLVPTHNREDLLPRCLASIRAQTLEDFNVVIGDNASDDASQDIVRSLGDPRFALVVRPTNLGHVPNHNLLLDEVTGDYVAFLHSDDWWEPDYLSRLVALLDATPGAFMGISAARLVFPDSTSYVERLDRTWPTTGDTVLTSEEAVRLLVRKYPYVTPSNVVARREMYQRCPPFDESLAFAANDWLMWLRGAVLGPVAICFDPLANNLKHASSITGAGERRHTWAHEHAKTCDIVGHEWGENGEPYPGAVLEMKSLTTMRFLYRAYESAEEGSRVSAVELAQLAGQVAPTRRWKLLARSCEAVFGVGNPRLYAGAARGLQWVSKAASPMLLPLTGRGSDGHYLVWSLRSVLAREPSQRRPAPR
jgi:hypothetical protein